MPRPEPFDLIIFDCDGTLVDSEPAANRVLAELLTEIGLPTTTEEAIRDYMGRSMAACLGLIEQRLGRPLPEQFVDGWRDRTFSAFRDGLDPVPGVHAALERIAVPSCVASSGPHEKMEVTLGLTGLLERFAGRIFSATEVERGKPSPDLFLYAAARMGATPDRCAVIEDSALGVQAGCAAGMTVFGFAAASAPGALRAAGAHVEFREMHALPALLGSADPGDS